MAFFNRYRQAHTRARIHVYTQTHTQLDTFLAQSRQSHNSYFLRVALVSKKICSVRVCVYVLRAVVVPGSSGEDQ